MQLFQSRLRAPSGASAWRAQQLGLPAVTGRARLHWRSPRQHVALASHAEDRQQQPAAPAGDASLVPQGSNGSDITAPGSDAGSTRVNVQFVVPEYLTHWGQVLKVVGSMEELGNWKVEKAPAMEWNEGHTWTLNVQLPVGAVNFKVVMSEAHGGVRWEQGDNRSMLIPETTSVSGAPVGQVGVTCNFNDVSNTRVEVRPDRAFLKQQLKAVEARVSAIQEKKRKLDARMSVLTEGLKKYDSAVAMLEGGVQEAIEARQRDKEAAMQQQIAAASEQAAAAAIAGDGGSAQAEQPAGTGTSSSSSSSQGWGFNQSSAANNGSIQQQQQEQDEF
ncbi:hypothetical protein OEZ86_001659 [Tetradesmus obliquus]|nr:hypothetical protein OEZ86_001659 [Tetradesmus obliquus]